MTPDAIRDEKLKVLRSLKPFTDESVARDVVRGQYRAGNAQGKKVAGYADESKVPSGQYLRDVRGDSNRGSELALGRRSVLPAHGQAPCRRDAQIVVNFRTTPHSIFPGVNQPNKLVIKLQPEDGLELHLLAAKGTGQQEMLTPVSLDLDFDKAICGKPRRRVRAAAA